MINFKKSIFTPTNGQKSSVEEMSELRCTRFSISVNERRFKMVDQPPERVQRQEYISVNRSEVNNHSNRCQQIRVGQFVKI